MSVWFPDNPQIRLSAALAMGSLRTIYGDVGVNLMRIFLLLQKSIFFTPSAVTLFYTAERHFLNTAFSNGIT